MAYKFILKHSSILGKRPTSDNVQPGELALNTNSEDPGVFYEVTDGNVVKVGPVSTSFSPPVSSPEKGESWFDLGGGTLNIGTVDEAKKVWRSISAPFLGGGGNCVFVAPEFAFSSDGLTNNGQALPYQTLTRAILELSKIYIKNVLGGFSTRTESNRYTVFVSSLTTVNNAPGSSVDDFNVDFSSDILKEVTLSDLVQFNTVTGGVVVPSGISIQGMDLKKSLMSPSYVPTYRNPFFPLGLQGENQPITSLLKCSGNGYLYNFSVVDKIDYSEIVRVTEKNTFAVFRTKRPHGLGFNDFVDIQFNPNVDQTTGILTSGNYYAIPINTFEFYLSSGSQLEQNSLPYVLYSDIPLMVGVVGPLLTLSIQLKSAHRLRLVGNLSFSELGDYYTKVQKAFSSYFGGSITDGKKIVNSGDYVIVGPTALQYPDNESSNTVRNSSLYANQVNLRSEYGMCWGDFDGSIVDGFKSVTVNACTAVSLQNDPCVYEIYTTLVNSETGESEQKWWNLTTAKFLSIPAESRPELITQVPVSDQLDLLNSTPLNNIRYYYQNLTEPTTGKNIGIVDIENDFRHFGFRTSNGAYAQLQSIYTIGPAIGVWSLNGGTCNLTNSTSNFGSVSFKSEGFLGINTIDGASPNSKGFILEGVQRPLALSRSQVESLDNKRILSLGAKIKGVYIDPADPFTQILELSADFLPGFILPFSLKPGTALWVDTEECTYRGFFVTDGGPTVITGLDDPLNFAKLRIRSSDSTIPNDPELLPVLGIPYIRRFKDPRQDFDRSYSLYLKNTSPTAVAPQVGSVLRLNQTSQQIGVNSLRPNVQFDPGILGGWGRVFTVDAVETGSLGSSPQFNYVIADNNQALDYFVAITASDLGRPWTQSNSLKTPVGSYTVHKDKNWYTAENNLWDCVYYGQESSFNSEFGPFSAAPFQPYSPFVDTSTLERQDKVSETFQGTYAPDPNLSIYADGESYFRGATSPYPTYSTQDFFDGDDSSESLGICLSDAANGPVTYTVSVTEIIQTEREGQLASEVSPAVRYRPAVIEFSVLSSVDIPNPKQKVSVLQLSSSNYTEYVRVINLNGTVVRAIRLNFDNSSYPTALPAEGSNYIWPQLTRVAICSTNPLPEPSLYDPAWTNTKRAIFRFFEVMGYSNSVMYQFLEPKFWGERLLSISSLNDILPSNGYATVTDNWPLEFNQPSTVIANTHTWGYTGYYNYSRGLLKYQSTDITRKLAADFQAYTLWSGRLTVTGINDKGEIIQFGPQRQALTANYYEPTYPIYNLSNQQIYEEQAFVEFPSQVLVYSTDDISPQFNGSNTTFNLTRSGLAIPSSQLLETSMLVVLGAVAQKPGIDYKVEANQITFLGDNPAPVEGTVCNIRVFTTVDSEKTLIAVPLTLSPGQEFDGVRTIFTATSSIDISSLEISSNNTFVILGGVEQIPVSDTNSSLYSWSYSLEKTSPTEVTITFNGQPPAGSTIDMRAICTGSYWASRSIYPVAVYSLDPISDQFDGARTVFDLTYGGKVVNASTVTKENLILSLGGSLQVPGVSYTIEGSQLIFSDKVDAPKEGTSVNIRVITNAEFISCPT